MRLKEVRKHHLSVFTTNLMAIFLSIFFIKTYVSRGIPVAPLLLVVSLLTLAVFSLFSFFSRFRGRQLSILPPWRLLAANLAISVVAGLIFLAKIGWDGLLFVLVFSFLLYSTEHMIHEGFRK